VKKAVKEVGKPSFPKTLTKEFLLVDLVNNLDQLAEAKSEVLERVRERATSYDVQRLRRAVILEMCERKSFLIWH
jgi:hypothetical protein